VDINPVAWFIVKKIVEPVSLRALDDAYLCLEQTVASEIKRLYETPCPRCAGQAQAVYTYWVKTINCRLCGEKVPLRKSMIVCQHMGKPHTGLVTCPRCGNPYLSSTLNQRQRCPTCGTTFDPRERFSRGAWYICPVCGARDQIIQALRDEQESPRHAMVAMYVHCPICGNSYKKPGPQDLDDFARIRQMFAEREKDLLFPRTPIPPGYNTNQMLNYNYRFWFQMFNERQLLGLSALLRAIQTIEDQNVREFILLLFSGTLEFNNMFCSSKGLGTGAIRHLFAHHAFIPAKEPLEANLWGVNQSSGGFSTLYHARLRQGKAYAKQPVERRLVNGKAVKVRIVGERIESVLAGSFEELISSPEKHALLLNQSSAHLTHIPDSSIDAVITDPPYLDNVMYSELSDFFYVWLRLALKDAYPQFKRQLVNPEDEAIKNVEQGKGTLFYQATLTSVFQECERVLKDEGLLVFTYHHGSAEAWDTLAQSLKDAGFTIVRLWPVHAEMDVGVPILGKQSVKFDTILVCRKKKAFSREPLPRPTSISELVREEVQQMIQMLKKDFTITEIDHASLTLAVATMLFTQCQTPLLPSRLVSISEV